MNKISSGTIHQLPEDLKEALIAGAKALTAWESLTPLARNEWICWVISGKQQETRDDHIKRAVMDLIGGKRRPCCWMGCIHRTDKPLNDSQKYLISRSSKKEH